MGAAAAVCWVATAGAATTCCGGGLADGTDPHPEEAEGARGDKDPTRSAEVVDREDEPPPAPATPDGRVADDVTDGGLCCWDDTFGAAGDAGPGVMTSDVSAGSDDC